ncbi:Acetyltransf_1 domain-containing [Olea europaea subsp. europaea]|uniref:Acetyltransf_1 domain-containing n=1 Tax=Olea europaea subsp. europaea TaxID=158383 RepID=A0A8S0UVL8_OLEEU|nr:Acetyltransf_1 domain-containing [Olea europaea subsp. europaea]
MSIFLRTSSYSYGYRVYSNFHRNPSPSAIKNANSIPSRTKKELSKEIQRLSTPHVQTFTHKNLKFDKLQPIDELAIHENRVEFGQFVAREALLDEEFWVRCIFLDKFLQAISFIWLFSVPLIH